MVLSTENIDKLIWWHIKKYNYIFQSFQYIAIQNVCAKKIKFLSLFLIFGHFIMQE